MYSAETLRQIRDAKVCHIRRSTRKSLFKLNLWNPVKSTQVTGIKERSQQKSDRLHLGLINARSVNNKGESIHDLIVDNKLDICAITETWLNENSAVSVGNITPAGYSTCHLPRQSRGGGVAAVHRQSLSAKTVSDSKYTTFEYLEICFTLPSELLRVIVFYYPSGTYSPIFVEEFTDFLDKHIIKPGKFVLIGDFNFHVDDQNDTQAQRFIKLLDSYNLKQHVTNTTHEAGHTLDLIITRTEELCVSDIKIDNSVPSDHSAVIFNLPSKSPGLPTKVISYRKWRNIDTTSLKEDINDSALLSSDTHISVSQAVQLYDNGITKIIDKHAPVVTKEIKIRPNTSWYTSEIAREKRKRRKLERKWRKSRLQIDRDIFKSQRQHVNSLICKAKQEYYAERISNAKGHKELYSVCNELLNKQKTSVLPKHDCAKDLADRFINYFTDKITVIRDNLKSESGDSSSHAEYLPAFFGNPLDKLRPATCEEVRKIICASPTKSCSLDPLPTWLLKDCIDTLLPVLTSIINISLYTSDFSPELKRALITPLIKKVILDCEILKNYRPVSNLSFLSKLIERIVAVRFVEHLTENGLYEIFQSAYRQLHSTETALLRVQNDILEAVDSHGGAILVLLDLSAAFDTIDHEKLLRILEQSFGVTDDALNWFKSYLSDRTQEVVIDGKCSEIFTLLFGVPQGSVLGPILFTIYTVPLGQIIRKHGLSFHLYADDTQLYIAFKPTDSCSTDVTLRRIQDCVADIKAWMTENLLKLNDDKTEILVVTSKHLAGKLKDIRVKLGDIDITPRDAIRNLGVIFDNTCSMEQHISNICKTGYWQLHQIGQIRKYLDKPSAQKLVNSLITSRMDYCNSLLYGVSNQHLRRLTSLQNACARLVTRARKFDHITPVLMRLHWLPVKERIEFKILLLTYKSLHGLAPQYLRDLLHIYHPARSLRSEAGQQLVIPRTRLATYGDRMFSKVAPQLWNELPINVRSASSPDVFKKTLKTYLFRRAFSDTEQ